VAGGGKEPAVLGGDHEGRKSSFSSPQRSITKIGRGEKRDEEIIIISTKASFIFSMRKKKCPLKRVDEKEEEIKKTIHHLRMGSRTSSERTPEKEKPRKEPSFLRKRKVSSIYTFYLDWREHPPSPPGT